MTIIQVATSIAAPIDDVFDAYRNIMHHEKSSTSIKEKIVDGKTWGLMEVGDVFTVQYEFMGLKQNSNVEVSAMDAPYFFEDRQVAGILKSFSHKHYFTHQNGETIVRDIITYEVGNGPFVSWINKQFIEKRINQLLTERHEYFKQLLEKKSIPETV